MTVSSTGNDITIDNIIEKYSSMVYKLAYARTRNREDADDIFQEVFLRYIRKQPKFEKEEHEKAWFIRVTINCFNSFWKNSFRTHTVPLDMDFPINKTEDQIIRGYTLEEYLAKLPPVYRIAIHLFYYEDMSTAQISELLNRKESTIRMQLTRARRLLREYMKEEENYV
ncbi:DNA-directed RNA polymerase sigma-70 factor [Anaerocolumna cellulosilytica]|uniref:DNA-directed RNA polymerase sigma-70 factor n=1 Tax=Anaerocolumna cellulosilytica TaxID=433286 RepID=A0A6S6QYT9_9FIRM|nr:RNA polymerase sigma factor [Anaerocolumna cellulosilytica]MBB5193858.1 RNA polymerase sigma-70 factor (ECF subfamily) [Anaerocolumna cellulosilytica]BCJ94926.1 DNA-directed RNA polymerase sigma-70 factor [Anaerocolumna cellulosilytica]